VRGGTMIDRTVLWLYRRHQKSGLTMGYLSFPISCLAVT
jgi:hypothetical protein